MYFLMPQPFLNSSSNWGFRTCFGTMFQRLDVFKVQLESLCLFKCWQTTFLPFYYQTAKAIVYIEEMNSMADVTFPSVPQVASLLIYDDTSRAKDRSSPIAGYPVICITVSISVERWNKISRRMLFKGAIGLYQFILLWVTHEFKLELS